MDDSELCPQTIDMKGASHDSLYDSSMLLRDEYLMARDFIISYAEAHPRNGLVVSGQSGIGLSNHTNHFDRYQLAALRWFRTTY